MKHIALLFSLTALLQSGCSHFKSTQLIKEAQTTTTASFDTSTLSATAHLIARDDLNSAARTLTSSVEFIAVTLKNKTPQPLVIPTASLTPACMTEQQLQTHIPQQYGCYFIPAIVMTVGGFFFTWQLGLPFASLFTLFGFDQSRRAAARTKTSITKHCIATHHQFIVPPYSTATMLVVLDKKNYTGTLTFTAHAAQTAIPCHLQLHKKIATTYTLI